MTINALYQASQSVVMLGDAISTCNWFSTQVGVRQGCSLSQTFLENIIMEALVDLKGV